MVRQACYAFPFGTVIIGYDESAVTHIRIQEPDSLPNIPSSISDWAAMQLQEYFEGIRCHFTFPVRIDGTDFQKSVWRELSRIPYGHVRSYSQIASAIGKPNASRAVGMACSRNPLWFVIPCHRVIGKNGALTGYAGGAAMKQYLLDLEKNHS